MLRHLLRSPWFKNTWASSSTHSGTSVSLSCSRRKTCAHRLRKIKLRSSWRESFKTTKCFAVLTSAVILSSYNRLTHAPMRRAKTKSSRNDWTLVLSTSSYSTRSTSCRERQAARRQKEQLHGSSLSSHPSGIQLRTNSTSVRRNASSSGVSLP